MGRGTSNIVLREKRNKAIVERFNYYYHVRRFRYDYVLELLKWDHFFMDEPFLHSIIKKAGCSTPVYKIVNSSQKDGYSVFQARNAKIRNRFEELYSKNQMRMDDSVTVLSNEFYMSSSTIDKVLTESIKYRAAKQQTTIIFPDL